VIFLLLILKRNTVCLNIVVELETLRLIVSEQRRRVEKAARRAAAISKTTLNALSKPGEKEGRLAVVAEISAS
jgi:hypothetical protein